jgi:hypothetical protein
MNINDFLGIAIVGAALSLVIEWMQEKYGMDAKKTRALSIVLSFVVGGFYWLLSNTEIWQSILGVLAAASTVYALFFNSKIRG